MLQKLRDGVRYPRCIRTGGMEAPVLWGRVAKTCCGRPKKSARPEDGVLPSEVRTKRVRAAGHDLDRQLLALM